MPSVGDNKTSKPQISTRANIGHRKRIMTIDANQYNTRDYKIIVFDRVVERDFETARRGENSIGSNCVRHRKYGTRA